MKEIYDLTKEQQEKTIYFLRTDPGFRKEFFRTRLYSFGLWYFPHFFNIKSSKYHKAVTRDLLGDDNVLLITYREFGKSIWILVEIIHGIVYKRFNFLLYFSYEQRLSASRLFDIIVQLKTNQLLINDFGQLFPDSKTKDEDGLQKKSVAEFITLNRVKVKAMSMGMTARGLLYSTPISIDSQEETGGAFRPDALYLDDIDTLESVRNPDMIDKNDEFLQNEVIGGVDSNCKIVFLGNIIGVDGLVPRFETRAKKKGWITHKIPIKIGGEITWDRFVETDQEAEDWEKKGVKKISLEKKKREQGEGYMPNFELIPLVRYGNPVFDHSIIQSTPTLEYKLDSRYKELRIYQDKCQCVFGLDSAGGNPDGDYSTIVAYNYEGKLVLTYQAKVAPDILADVMEYIVSLGYRGKIIPENNSIGISLIDKLKTGDCQEYLHYERDIDSITQRPKKKYGFNTNGKSKALIIGKLEEKIRKGEIVEFDERTKSDLLSYYYDNASTNALKGSYDDLVMATAICLYGVSLPRPVQFI